jgi:hypothetical protein
MWLDTTVHKLSAAANAEMLWVQCFIMLAAMHCVPLAQTFRKTRGSKLGEHYRSGDLSQEDSAARVVPN